MSLGGHLLAQGPGPTPEEGTGAAATASSVAVTSLNLSGTDLGDGVYQGEASCTFTACCSNVGSTPMYCSSKLEVGIPGLSQDVIEVPLQLPYTNMTTVAPGQTITWSFDNADPGPAPTFVDYTSDGRLRAFADVHGFQGSSLVDSDSDLELLTF